MRHSRPVTVTRYAAEDGSLHDSPSSAAWHDSYAKERRQIEAVKDVIDVPISVGCLSPQCTLFDGGWCDDREFDRNQLIESIADLIIKNLPDINAALAKAEGR